MIFNYIHWNVNPELVNVFGISLRYYGLLFVAGIVASGIVLNELFKHKKIESDYLDKVVVYILAGVILGARLGHCFFYETAYYLQHPIEMLLPIQANPNGGYYFSGYQGLASHGAVIGLLISLIFYCRLNKQSYIGTFDLITIAAPLGGGFVRIANLMNSEIIGIPSTVPWAFVFEKIDQQPRHPAQLYEALAYFLIFIVLIILYKKMHNRVNKGFFVGVSLSLVFIARFFIEFIKERQSNFEENMILDMGQILSIPFIIAGLYFVYYGLRKASPINN